MLIGFAATSVVAQNAGMSDAQVMQYVQTGLQQGKSQQQLTSELARMGVTRQQAERIKKLYQQNQKNGKGLGKNTTSNSRLRTKDGMAIGLEGEMTNEQIAAEVFDFLSRTIERQIEAACEMTGCRQALLAGGVASSTLLRDMLEKRAKKRRLNCRLCFARPELSGDNAVGVALLGAGMFRESKEE